MDSKFTIFVVFAVLTQSSRAVNDTAFADDFAALESAEKSTIVQLTDILDGYVEVIHLLANVSCRNQDYDAADVNSTIEAIKQRQYKSSNTAYDQHRSGLKRIGENVAVLDTNLEASYATFAAQIALMQSPSAQFPSKDYSETLAAIRIIEEIGLKNIENIWIAVYEIVKTVVATDNVELSNLLEHVQHAAIVSAKSAFGTIFTEFEILLIQHSDETQCQSTACLFAIETQRNFALSKLVSEIRTKFSTFKYIATANFTGESQLIADYNKIRTAEVSAVTAAEYSYDAIENVLISALEEKEISPKITNTLRSRLSSGFFTAYVNTLTALSYTQPQGSAIVEVNAATGYESMNAVIDTIIEMVKLIQKHNNASEILTLEIEALEDIATTETLTVFKEVYDLTEKIIGSFDERVGAAFGAAWNTTTTVLLKNVIENIFDGIEIAIYNDTHGSEIRCGAGVEGIKTAFSAAIYNFKNGLSATFDSIRAIRLYRSFEANGIDIPFSALMTLP